MPDRELVASVAIIREEIAASAKDRRWMKRAMRFMMVAGAILLAVVCVLIYVVWTQSDDNATKVQTQGEQTKTTAAKVEQQEVQGNVSRRRSRAAEQKAEQAPLQAARRLVQYVNGERGIRGVKGADGKDGTPGPRGGIGPTGKVGPTGATGPMGPAGPAPTAAQISQAAKDACAAGLCDNITPQELAAEVASQIGPAAASALKAYCDARDDCRGPKGEKGEKGDPGADSTVPGPPGATGETGAQGAHGETGPAGPPGACNPATINTVDGPVAVCVP